MRKRRINPFNVLLLVVGVLFVLTACGFAVMTVRGASPADAASASQSGQQLLDLLKRYGMAALLIELSVLMVAALGVMTTDHWWAGQSEGRPDPASNELPARRQ